MAAPKIGFVNRTQGYVGATKVNRKGEEVGVPVAPGDRIFLTEEEVELTAQSHAHAEDSPFTPKEIVIRDPDTGDETERFTAPPLERVEKPAARSRRRADTTA